MNKLAIVIPAHNEEKRIGATLKSYLSYFKNIKGADIIVVINACTDNTRNIVYHNRNNRLKILEFVKGGKGFAVIEGFRYSLNNDYDFVGFVDADMSTKPDEFYRLFSKIKGYDGVIASRYLRGAKLNPKNTFLRIIASRVYNLFIRSLLMIPYRDTQCGAKIFKASSLGKIIDTLGMTSWAFDIELLYKLSKKGFKILEEPTTWSNKEGSKINFWQSGPWMALAVFRLRILNSPFKDVVKAYDKFIGMFKPAK